MRNFLSVYRLCYLVAENYCIEYAYLVPTHPERKHGSLLRWKFTRRRGLQIRSTESRVRKAPAHFDVWSNSFAPTNLRRPGRRLDEPIFIRLIFTLCLEVYCSAISLGYRLWPIVFSPKLRENYERMVNSNDIEVVCIVDAVLHFEICIVTCTCSWFGIVWFGNHTDGVTFGL